ncbi:hypothetical protein FXN63_15110 [Pigmentiphaga aceris]|uniref:Uncharacterized protein n=1 Tax=Pigmentiphaga aceris TaxID=1940612 RepID=A0A5C0AXE3_9BURK|nr:hypothetical protein [Pigmentiphaga aceris]QEI07018.1 hypothetical protein FXN63_15110 [Pigmentiphaga aceris]
MKVVANKKPAIAKSMAGFLFARSDGLADWGGADKGWSGGSIYRTVIFQVQHVDPAAAIRAIHGRSAESVHALPTCIASLYR